MEEDHFEAVVAQSLRTPTAAVPAEAMVEATVRKSRAGVFRRRAAVWTAGLAGVAIAVAVAASTGLLGRLLSAVGLISSPGAGEPGLPWLYPVVAVTALVSLVLAGSFDGRRR